MIAAIASLAFLMLCLIVVQLAHPDDPNLTDKRFPGNPTQSFRSREPLRVVGELVDWVGHAPEKLEAMRAALDALQRNGTAQIED